MSLNKLLATSAIVVAGTSAEAATKLAFDAFNAPGTGITNAGPTIVESGFVFSNLSDNGRRAFITINNSNPLRPLGQAAVGNGTRDGITRLETVSGNTFDLISIDLTENIINDGSSVVSFTGFFENNTTISQSFTLDGTFGLETFSFTGFTGLTKVEWANNAPYHLFDNVVVNEIGAIPLPAGLPLMVGALGAFGALRLRKKAAA